MTFRSDFKFSKVKHLIIYTTLLSRKPSIPWFIIDPDTPRVFFDEFGSYLETIILFPECLILVETIIFTWMSWTTLMQDHFWIY